jgi:peptidoglycan/LPS O-acetylase OafA/YrhL
MLRNVQLLRALAAIMVVVGHLQPLLTAASPGLAWVKLGHAGVDLFFVISGFVMVYTIDRGEPAPGVFAWRRLTRIAPLYWLATLGVFALACVAPQLLTASRPDPAWLLKSLAFVPFAKGDGTFDPLLPVGWTLNYEMFFYAVLALSLFAGPRLRYVVCGGLILALCAVGFARVPLQGAPAIVYTRPIMVEFVLGMLLGRAFAVLPAVRGGAAAVAVAAGGCSLLAALVLSGLDLDEPGRVAMAAPAAAGVLFCALVLERGGAASRSRAGLAIGNASYSLYLTHVYVLQGVRFALAAAHLTSPAACAAGAVATLAGAVALALAVHRLFEQPVTRALNAVSLRPALVALQAE